MRSFLWILLASFTKGSTTGISNDSPTSSGTSMDWTSVPSDGAYSTSGFGERTASSGSSYTYKGNVGNPYGSNIIEVTSSAAHAYKYVIRFQGHKTEGWQVVIWNKFGEDGKMDGWFSRACHIFCIAAGETKYYAFDEDSQGGWAAAKGTVPTNNLDEYASTWGEFDLGSSVNNGWSGFDVSAIVAQNSGMIVQGMKVCEARTLTCSSVTSNAQIASNAYTTATTGVGGIGGNLPAGPVRLVVTLDY